MTEGYGHTLTGDIEQHAQFASRILKNQRDIWVYLPPGYRRSTSRRYPVFYLHDGQNVFDAATAFGGTEWNADEASTLPPAVGLNQTEAPTPKVAAYFELTGVFLSTN